MQTNNGKGFAEIWQKSCLKNNAMYYYRTLDAFNANNSCFQKIAQAYLEKISSQNLRKPITKRKRIVGKIAKAKKESFFSGQNQCLLLIKQIRL